MDRIKYLKEFISANISSILKPGSKKCLKKLVDKLLLTVLVYSRIFFNNIERFKLIYYPSSLNQVINKIFYSILA